MSRLDYDGEYSVTIVLFLIFLVLKLCKVIDWSWWWVTAPLWGSIVLVLIPAIIWAIVDVIKDKQK